MQFTIQKNLITSQSPTNIPVSYSTALLKDIQTSLKNIDGTQYVIPNKISFSILTINTQASPNASPQNSHKSSDNSHKKSKTTGNSTTSKMNQNSNSLLSPATNSTDNLHETQEIIKQLKE